MPRLDRFLSVALNVPRKSVHTLLANGRVHVDDAAADDMSQRVNDFSKVVVDGRTIQNQATYYVMLNKPKAVVSATRDSQHKTVIDLLDYPFADQLHIVGRLDYNSTGLLLLTNDGAWSRRLSLPENKLLKRYRVTVEKPLTSDYINAFRQGMYFAYEDITTQPAELMILGDHEAEVGLVEGKYHQIKRMFGRFDNRVLSLHRIAIGPLKLDPTLAPGRSRQLTLGEMAKLED